MSVPQNRDILFFLLFMIMPLSVINPVVAEESGFITITTDPPNASLYIDGQLIGITPIHKYPLPQGEHAIYLRDQTQQRDYSKTVEIFKNNETALNISLKKDYGKLTVTCKPDSSEIFLLTPIGKTPLIDEQIDQGTFTLEIRKTNSRYLPLRKNNIYIDKNNPGVISDPLTKRKIMTKKAWWQIGLGAASIGSYCWSFYQGYDGKRKNQAIPGFVIGTACLVGVEIIALF